MEVERDFVIEYGVRRMKYDNVRYDDWCVRLLFWIFLLGLGIALWLVFAMAWV